MGIYEVKVSKEIIAVASYIPNGGYTVCTSTFFLKKVDSEYYWVWTGTYLNPMFKINRLLTNYTKGYLVKEEDFEEFNGW